jgi:hypothetical protein
MAGANPKSDDLAAASRKARQQREPQPVPDMVEPPANPRAQYEPPQQYHHSRENVALGSEPTPVPSHSDTQPQYDDPQHHFTPLPNSTTPRQSRNQPGLPPSYAPRSHQSYQGSASVNEPYASDNRQYPLTPNHEHEQTYHEPPNQDYYPSAVEEYDSTVYNPAERDITQSQVNNQAVPGSWQDGVDVRSGAPYFGDSNDQPQQTETPQDVKPNVQDFQHYNGAINSIYTDLSRRIGELVCPDPVFPSQLIRLRL